MKIDRKTTKYSVYTFNRNLEDIEEIVIHATGGGRTLKFVESGGREEEYKKGIGLFHYLIQKEPCEIIQILDLERWCYHSSAGKHDKKTIAIEIEKYSVNNQDDPIQTQYSNLVMLLSHIIEKCPNITSIVSHDFNRKKYSNKSPKPCPGNFNWDLIKNNFKTINFHH